MIVEDSLTQAEQLRGLLEGRGFRVSRAADGKQALEIARQSPPALIISDVIMPQMDGYELCREIKADERLRDVPVILVTTLADARDVVRGLECGADNFIRKPYEERYLLSRINYLLMNTAMRKDQRVQMGVEVNLGGTRHFITAERQQILDLLISTYEQAVDLNNELSMRQAELAQANRMLEALYELGEGLNRATGVREVAEVALERLQKLPGIDAAWIVLGTEGEDAEVVASRGLPSGFWEQREGSSTRASALVPLRLAEHTIGHLNLLRLRGRSLDDKVVRILPSAGDQISVALERARLHERLGQLVDERTAELKEEVDERRKQEQRVLRLNRLYSVLSHINHTIVHVRERGELFQRVCDIAVEHGGLRFAWIGTIEQGSGRPQPAAQTGDGSDYDVLVNIGSTGRVPAEADLTLKALESHLPVICNDIAADTNLQSWRDLAVERGCCATVVLPILLDGKPAATLSLFAGEANVFDDEELRLLEEMSADISFALEHMRKSERLHEMAFYDDVTKLPNRALTLEHLTLRLAEGDDSGQFAVLMLDLDRFKTINDSLGQEVGDLFLRRVGERLVERVENGGMVARIAGDEFALLLSDLQEPDDAARVVEKLLDYLREPLDIDGYELFPNACVGIALYPEDGTTAEELLKKAGVAMYRAKSFGSGSYRYYAPQMGVDVSKRLALETSLRRALEAEEFRLHYQPVVELKSNRIVGVEALVRWQQTHGNLISPGEFIPVAEDTGIIVELGQWVLKAACEQASNWSKFMRPPPRMNVNVSPRQFRQPDFYQSVKGILEATGLDPRQLTLEITESHLMQDVEHTMSVMASLGDLGVQFSIDDFGTGYSSFAYLSRLRINSLKIDRSFIRNLPNDDSDIAIVSAIISMAHSLGLFLVAEGVETQEQLDFLRSHHCDNVQGYLLGKPAHAEEIAWALASRARRD